MTRSDIVLVSMPWSRVSYPSIQLGILKSLLASHGLSVSSASLNVDFFEYLAAARRRIRLSIEEFDFLGETVGLGLGEWIFSGAVYDGRESDPEAYEQFVLARGDYRAIFDKARRIRDAVPDYLTRCVDLIATAEPRVVGFSSTFVQNLPSLALARRLKARFPDVKIVFGGANCDGPMGRALIEQHPWIDVVVRGEAEPVAPLLFQQLVAGECPAPQPKLCIRREAGLEIVDGAEGAAVDPHEVPLPDYDEYFDRIAHSRVLEDADVKGLTYESARGCWWGAKQHCTFCGLNGTTMAFRSKSADRVLDDLRQLSEKYKKLHFFVVDNIIDFNHIRTLLPAVRDSGMHFSFYYETKANLKKHEVRLMRDAGVRSIQPGIESLSSPILKLMRKGTTALQNVRLLKWCAEYGVAPDWNLLYGFPDEPEAEYERMADIVLSLTHLPPPLGMEPLSLNRFSPYHVAPERFGMIVNGPADFYRFVYDADTAVLNDIAYFFEFGYRDGRAPEDYTAACHSAVQLWKDDGAENFRQLFYRRGPGFVQVVDRRSNMPQAIYTLEGAAAEAFLACDAGASVANIHAALSAASQQAMNHDELRTILREMCERRLMYEEDDRFLSLAVPEFEEHV